MLSAHLHWLESCIFGLIGLSRMSLQNMWSVGYMALCSFKHAFSPMTGRQRLLLHASKDQRILQMMLCKVHTMFKLRLMMMIITLRKEQTVHSAMDADLKCCIACHQHKHR